MNGAAARSVAVENLRPVLILAAMAGELAPLRGQLEHGESLDAGGRTVERGRLGSTGVVLARTGVGRVRAAAAADALIDRFDPSLVVVLGVAGGLSTGLRPGDLVVADEVRDDDGPLPAPDPEWVTRALQRGGVVCGTAYTSSRILCTPAEKATARNGLPENRVAVVDLESAAVARAAGERGVPYLVLRAISDTADESLPFDMNRCRDRDGDIRTLAVVGRALTRPSGVPELWRLRRRLESCAHELAGRIRGLLDGESS